MFGFEIKKKKMNLKLFNNFGKFAQNIDCGTRVVPLIFVWIKDKNNRIPLFTKVLTHKRGVHFFHGHVFLMRELIVKKIRH